MKFLLLMFLLSACEKPQVVQKRGLHRAQGEEPASPAPNEDKRFQLSWTKAPQAVTQYEIRFGLTETSIAEKILIVDTAQNFDPEKPSALVTVAGERLAGRSKACFQIVAANAKGASEPSDPHCVALP